AWHQDVRSVVVPLTSLMLGMWLWTFLITGVVRVSWKMVAGPANGRTAWDLPLPVLCCGRREATVNEENGGDADNILATKQEGFSIALVVLRMLSTAVPFVMVVAITALVHGATALAEAHRITSIISVFCTMVPGCAAVYLCARASTSHTWSTAGFFFCTWAVGLGTVVDVSFNSNSVAMNTAVSVVCNALYLVQQTWLVSLSAHRLHSLQRSAGHQFFPNVMARAYCVGAGYVLFAIAVTTANGLKGLWMPPATSVSVFAPHVPAFCLRHFALGVEIFLIGMVLYPVFLVCLCYSLAGLLVVIGLVAIAFCLRVLLAYCRILGHLTAARRVAERSNCRRKVSGLRALQRGERALRKEIFGFALCFLTNLILQPLGYMFQTEPLAVLRIECGMILGYTMGVWFLSNSYRLSKRAGPNLLLRRCAMRKSPPRQRRATDAAWQAKVAELSTRGITARELLEFYKQLGSRTMPHYSAGMHTTGDVVRQAIIPITRSGCCSYAEVTGREPLRPAKMVTHSWRNLFRDLVAAVIADAVRETSFELISQLLEHEVSVLETLLEQQGKGDQVYWICAFSVNQHLSICENLFRDKDSVTGHLHAGCDCGLPKILNTTPPLSTEGQSISCEMNKFDDMMALLAEEVPEFSQVVAVDSQFRLFSRAWCVAELVEAHESSLKQFVKMHSRHVLEKSQSELQELQVEDMQASRAEDVQLILDKISDKSEFNQKLQSLIFDEAGLLSGWCQLDTAGRMEEVGQGKADSSTVGLSWCRSSQSSPPVFWADSTGAGRGSRQTEGAAEDLGDLFGGPWQATLRWGKGIASSAVPYKRTPPTWLKMKPEDVCDHICKLAKKGLTPSQIGVTLRDSFGVPQVKNVTGNHILRILKTNGLAPTLPEDLYYLIKKAVSIRKHLDKNRKDKDAKFRLILVESRIHRLARYYKRVKSLPATWKYVSATASALVA
ncbi:RPS13, partial [Symbiodinium sp. CCMP2456]